MNGSFERHAFDRRLYMAAAVGFTLIVIAGFGRTYYARSWFGSPPLPSSLVHVHGLVMTAWVILFAAQVRLISAKRVRLHQRLGYAGIALGALIIATGVATAVRAAKYGAASFPQGISPLAFLLVPLFDLIMFALFFGAAIFYRRQAAAHKRLMLLTAINFLPPALARIPTERLQALGPLWFFGFPTAIAVLCLTLDARRHGRVNKVFLAGTILLVCSYVARLGLMTTAIWMNVATWLTSFA
jgi:hypothetical protein